MKKIGSFILVFMVCIGLSACGCEHEWQAADCEHPKTCYLCGETEGEPLGHSWQAADCEHPKICSQCGKTEGEALGHLQGDWYQAEEDFVNAEYHLEKRCSRCNEVMETKSEPMPTLITENGIELSLEQFEKRMNVKLDKILKERVHDNASTHVTEVDGTYYYFVEKNGRRLCSVTLMNDKTKLKPGEGTYFNVAMAAVYGPSSQIAAAGITAFAETLDPSFSIKDSAEFMADVVAQNSNNGIFICRNGISYSVLENPNAGRMVFIAIVIKPGSDLCTDENMGLAK